MNSDGWEKVVSAYREYPPPGRLSQYVECFWSHETTGSAIHRVLPDGCADLLLTRTGQDRHELVVVGTMTRARVFDVSNTRMLGVRFRPGMLPIFIRVSGVEIVDERIPLEGIWGARASNLKRQLADLSVTECIVEIERALAYQLNANGQPLLNSTQRALSWAEHRCGNVRVQDLAVLAGLSERQFRRVCLELTGLTPKHLCRALRCRHAAAQIINPGVGGYVEAALDSGYYDQAHFINEFRALSGLNPSEYRAEVCYGDARMTLR